MNILHINYTDLAGGRFTGMYMKEALDSSFNVEMAVWDKKSESVKVNELSPNNKLLHYFFNKLMLFTSRLSFDGLLGSSGWFINRKNYFKKADVIHIHLIHGFSNFSILSLPKLSFLKPMVWTLHDPWAMTGGCEHTFECEKWMTGCSPICPHPRCTSLFNRYTPYLHWRIKKWVYARMKVTIIVASEWMLNKVKKSPLLNHLPIKLIPFGVDINRFYLENKQKSRDLLGIPLENKVIAFRNTGLYPDKYKGIRWLKSALEKYEPTKPTTLLVLEGTTGFEELSNKFNIIYLGWVDGNELIQALSAADIFLMPSIQESFGLMAIEAMACETPVIVFDGTALPTIIKSGGIVVESKNSEKLAEAIELLITDDNKREELALKSRKIVETEYSYSLYVNKHIDLYNATIKQFESTHSNSIK
jgi:glycosyltransferase involved in cell wall biosynthesis